MLNHASNNKAVRVYSYDYREDGEHNFVMYVNVTKNSFSIIFCYCASYFVIDKRYFVTCGRYFVISEMYVILSEMYFVIFEPLFYQRNDVVIIDWYYVNTIVLPVRV